MERVKKEMETSIVLGCLESLGGSMSAHYYVGWKQDYHMPAHTQAHKGKRKHRGSYDVVFRLR